MMDQDRREELLALANTLNNHDVAHLLNILSDRLWITMPPSDCVTETKVCWVRIDGCMVDIVTEAWDEYATQHWLKESAIELADKLTAEGKAP